MFENYKKLEKCLHCKGTTLISLESTLEKISSKAIEIGNLIFE